MLSLAGLKRLGKAKAQTEANMYKAVVRVSRIEKSDI
jgi:hypothetical protein